MEDVILKCANIKIPPNYKFQGWSHIVYMSQWKQMFIEAKKSEVTSSQSSISSKIRAIFTSKIYVLFLESSSAMLLSLTTSHSGDSSSSCGCHLKYLNSSGSSKPKVDTGESTRWCFDFRVIMRITLLFLFGTIICIDLPDLLIYLTFMRRKRRGIENVNTGPNIKERRRDGNFRGRGSVDERTSNARKNGSSAFSRLDTREEERRHRRRNSDEDEEEYTNKPSVQSSVISNPNKLLIKTRRDSLIELKNDKKVMDRNRRMFGLLLGTLQKFQSEQTQQKDKGTVESSNIETKYEKKVQERKRQEIENKLEEAAVKEKEEVLKERKYLFLSRRKKQALLRRLERKVEIAKEFEDWEKLQKCYLHFIQTKAIPQIMYLPAKSTAVSEKRLSESSGEISAQIEERRKKMQDEIQELDEQDQIEGANSEKDDIDDNAASENIVEGNENNVDVSSSPQNKINDLSDIIGQVDGTESTCADSVKEPLTHVNDVNDINSSKQPSSNEQEFEPIQGTHRSREHSMS
ncbi:Pinin [Nymphon striatum]|nr:Pinin [Nymphon striatum]